MFGLSLVVAVLVNSVGRLAHLCCIVSSFATFTT